MADKPTYEELELKIKKLEKEAKKLPKTEEELKRKITELNSFINNVPAMAWLKDTDSRFIAVNREFGEAVGMSPESLINQTCEVCFGKEEAKKFREDDQKVMKSTKRVIIKEKITGPQKNEIWLETIKSPIFDESGKVLGTVGIARDITEHKKTEEGLRESQYRYGLIFNGSRDAIFLTGADAKFVDVNDAATVLTGYSKSELKRMSIPDLHEIVDLHAYETYFESIMAGKPALSEAKILKKDGTKVDTEFSNTKIAISGIPFMLTVARDITERKQTEEALQESEEKYRTIFENIQDVYFESGLDGVIIEISPSIESISKYKRDELIGKSVYDLYTNPDERDELVKVVLAKGRVSDLEINLTDKDGFQKLCSINTLLVVDEQRNPLKFVGSMRDITEGKKAEDALRNSEARLQALSDASFEAIFLSDKGVCLDQNQAAERMFGYTRAEAVGRHGTEWIVPEDREQVKNNMLSGYERPYEVTALRKDSTTFSCEIQARMIDYRGRPFRITALRDISERKQAEEALQEAHDKLEQRVKERTKELERKTRSLEEVNTALNVMLKKRDEDKLMMEEKVLFNVKELIDPLIENLKNSGLDENQTGYVDTLETFLAEIVSPFSQTLHTKYLKLTLSEIRVANLIKQGKTTKEIAGLLDSTPRAIEFHRQNLRKKLGLSSRKANLGSHLLSLLK